MAANQIKRPPGVRFSQPSAGKDNFGWRNWAERQLFKQVDVTVPVWSLRATTVATWNYCLATFSEFALDRDMVFQEFRASGDGNFSSSTSSAKNRQRNPSAEIGKLDGWRL
jgi:hypothetical protein